MEISEENLPDCFLLHNLIDTKQLSKYLNISYQTARLWTSQKKLPHYKIGRLVRFDLKIVNAFLRDNAIAVEGK